MAGTNVRVLMSEPHSLNDGIKVRAAGRMFTGGFVNTGVPHFVIETKNIDKLDIVKTGREIRFSKMFAPAGTNVMFIEKISADKYRIRSYERGVEDETLACGTGATASAIILASRGRVKSPVTFVTSGGVLKIHFTKKDAGFTGVWLEGPADIAAQGVLNKELFR